MLARLFALLLALLIPLSAAVTAQAEPVRRKLIVDDEGFGLMHVLLLADPDVEVLGLTTVTGNAWVNRATALALRGSELVGRADVPVVPGAQYPLLNTEALTERWETLYGKLTWKGAWMRRWVEPTRQSLPDYHGADDPVDLAWGNPEHTARSDETAAAFLIRMTRRYPGEVTIIAAGPLTNLALAQRLDPGFAARVGELVWMGGSFNPHQVRAGRSAAEFAREFANSPRREFNASFDPEAASIVLHSPWRKLTVVPVDPSTATELTPALKHRLQRAAAPGAAALIGRFEAGFPLWDEVAAAVWLDQGIVSQAQELYVDTVTQFGPTWGDTLSWSEGYQPGLGEQRARVVLAVDPARMERLMVDVLRKGRR